MRKKRSQQCRSAMEQRYTQGSRRRIGLRRKGWKGVRRGAQRPKPSQPACTPSRKMQFGCPFQGPPLQSIYPTNRPTRGTTHSLPQGFLGHSFSLLRFHLLGAATQRVRSGPCVTWKLGSHCLRIARQTLIEQDNGPDKDKEQATRTMRGRENKGTRDRRCQSDE